MGQRVGGKVRELQELRATQLACGAVLDDLDFETTEGLPSLEGIIGQERAERSVRFGLQIKNRGYNIFMSGGPGTGKSTYARLMLQEKAAEEGIPDDWCYVYNFVEPYQPSALRLPPGRGCQLRRGLEELVEDLRVEIPKVLSSAEFEKQKQSVAHAFQDSINEEIEKMEAVAKEHGFVLKRSSSGFITLPMVNGEPIKADDFSDLDEDTKKELEERSRAIQSEIGAITRRIRDLEKAAKERIKAIEQEVGLYAVGHLVDRVREKYDDIPAVLEYLDALQEDIINSLDKFKAVDEEEELPFVLMGKARGEDSFNRYKVNLLVDNSATEGAPVIFEPNPTYHNLFGKVEYTGKLGTLVTDFTRIKAGSLHRANGGYLVLQARDVLQNAFAWDTLKRTLRDQEIRVENLGEQMALTVTSGLKPEPVSIDVKVILLGTPLVHQLLYHYDPDFRKLFKLRADFADDMERSPEHLGLFASFLASFCRSEGLRHFTKGAVCRLVEHSSRLASSQDKLTTRFNEMTEVLVEAATWASLDGAAYTGEEHVSKALEERVYRSNLVEEKIQELIDEGKLLIDIEGEVVGQINGLSVFDAGDYLFGRPSRITAMTFMGKEGVINIERESEMTGQIHDKGLLILGGFLGGRYAQNHPLALSASLCFEQLYSGIDGDSASSTELFALLSSLAGLPIRQSIAVTGSVDQMGRIQPVGGVNEKIEGYFKTCKAKGLTGSQGVIIPEQNVSDLMLHKAVISAVEEGMFHIYPIATIDEGIQLLTGVPAGEADEDGEYPPDTVNGRVQARLAQWAEEIMKMADGDPDH